MLLKRPLVDRLGKGISWILVTTALSATGLPPSIAFAEATVPKITLITRKAYGGAYCVMNSKHIRADMNLAWPTAEVAVMGPDGAVNIVFRRELAAAEDPVQRREELAAEYREAFANPYQVASLGFIDAILRPENTRTRLIDAFDALVR